MNLNDLFSKFVGFSPMSHHPKLEPRFWVYCTAAYVIPVVSQVVFPSHEAGLYDELVWLITLAPAFLLSLHFGLRGALAGLLMGTALFIAVQLSVSLNYTPDDWRITVPIYVAYGALAISVGWLSEELHEHYRRALENERLAGVGQVAITLRHEVNNALTAIVAESHLLASAPDGLTEQQKRSAAAIGDTAMRIATDLAKLTDLSTAPTKEYLPGGARMLDLQSARPRG
jgi:glucose-6-phosphate-specific signal transduction histidine kinase